MTKCSITKTTGDEKIIDNNNDRFTVVLEGVGRNGINFITNGLEELGALYGKGSPERDLAGDMAAKIRVANLMA